MMQDDQDLRRLGQVAPPDPGALDAAREILWAAVAAEMLSGEAGEAGEAGQAGRTSSRRVAAHDQVPQREEDQAGRRPADPYP
jgi:hypothetical protein